VIVTEDGNMPDWLDSWTNVRRPSQQEMAKRWALPDAPMAEETPIIKRAPGPIPIEHTLKILKFGKKAYRKWEAEGFPQEFTWERIP
jgi:hypothetical protein